MKWFAVRVELHKNINEGKIEESTYDELHADMAHKGYFRCTITSDERWVMLPPAEYIRKFRFPRDVEKVRDEVTSITARLNRRASVYVVRTDGWAARGLDVITAEEALKVRQTG